MTSTLYVDNLQPSLGTQVEIPALKPLAGSVVQQYLWLLPTGTISPQNSSYTTAPTSSNTSLYATHTVTPIAANSTFIFEMTACIDGSVSSTGAEFVCLFQGSTLIGTSYWYRRTAGAEPYTYSIRGSYAHSGSATFDVDVRMKVGTSGLVLSVNKLNTGNTTTAQSSYLSVTEIAQ